MAGRREILPSSGRPGSLTARIPKKISKAPARPAAASACKIAQGAPAARLAGLLSQCSRRVEPVHHVRRHERRRQKRAKVAEVWPRPCLSSRTGSPARGELSTARSAIKQGHAAKLGDHADIVDPGEMPHPDRVDQGRDRDQQTAQQNGVHGRDPSDRWIDR